ncbi:hypothetical protein OG749_40175 [Streptomyces nojiriensis]|uniref:hypothetical protein n=1 Tax=Streptomyces nojiriensis TaxID=66374 RepID=UPI002E19BD58
MTERAANDARVRKNPVTLSLLKQRPKVPRNFRAKRSLVAGGQDVVLQWDGPDTLAYRIQGPAADRADLNDVATHRAQVKERLTLQGGLSKVNAGAHLSVRNAGARIMHTNDGEVAINGDLRVHGAFRSDS